MKLQKLPLFGLVCSLFLVGCGKTTPTPGANTQDAKPACELLTQDIAAAVLGESVPPSESKTMHSDEFGSTVTSCSYSTQSTDPTKIRTITLLVRYAKDTEESKSIFTDAKTQATSLAGTTPEGMDGIGEEAYWIGGSLNQLNVRKGTGWFIFSSYVRSGDQKQLETDMAKHIF